MPSKIAKKPTTKRAAPKTASWLDVRALRSEVTKLRARVEDLEDIRELNSAVARNAGKPGVPWEQAKAELGL
jgi:hypothetical protein